MQFSKIPLVSLEVTEENPRHDARLPTVPRPAPLRFAFDPGQPEQTLQ